MEKIKFIDKFSTMYPSGAWMIEDSEITLPDYCKYSSVYGYSFGDSIIHIDDKNYHLEKGQYFGLNIKNFCKIFTSSKIFVVCRLGYITPNVLGWIEKKGRLTYIDGCSDTILVYPSRMGDPSLNLLYFPKNINQSFHTHPSLRFGCIVDGYGIGDLEDDESMILNQGNMFCLDQQQKHRFKTEENYMTVIAFHPDGDWGPTDHNHIMINRTYL